MEEQQHEQPPAPQQEQPPAQPQEQSPPQQQDDSPAPPQEQSPADSPAPPQEQSPAQRQGRSPERQQQSQAMVDFWEDFAERLSSGHHGHKGRLSKKSGSDQKTSDMASPMAALGAAAATPPAPPLASAAKAVSDMRARLYGALTDNGIFRTVEAKSAGLRTKAMAYASAAQERVAAAVGYVQEAASVGVGRRVKSVLAAAEGARAQAVEYAGLVRSTVVKNVSSIRDDGVRAWVSSTQEVAAKVAREKIGEARSIAANTAQRAQAKAAEVAKTA
eukprot:CAMPEP_0170241546 /NCGR_PEP_ID=MMETSP0116_2-20130129/20542_1 /TAXON_ID=400756 /ORGANISM="Durinskia baltica, Strain CSIRO CS-38" /LENGTH=274 /DNA_ID=CAMNT_0010492387 /DNA_START=81 /DNA_END=901 /DNA_ORIENTATION=-